MTEEFNNPLDPVLDLTYSMVDECYLYELTIQVPEQLLKPIPVEEITDQQMVQSIAVTSGFTIMSEEVNDLYRFDSTNNGGLGAKSVSIPIRNNPSGEKGAVMVLISPVKTLWESPMTDGKAIIRFEKARLQ